MAGPAAVVAAALFVAIAGFQTLLALGAPFGAYVMGGRRSGTLPGRLRLASGVAAVILTGAGFVVLARAGVIRWPSGADGLLAPLTWLTAGLLIVNTLGNLASRSRFERTVFAAATATLSVLCVFVALAGSGPGG
jgi:hypothetical protein